MFQVVIYHQDLSFEQGNSLSCLTKKIDKSITPVDTKAAHGGGDGLITIAVIVVPALETLFKVSLKSSKSSNKLSNNTISNNDMKLTDCAVNKIDVDDGHPENNAENTVHLEGVEKSFQKESDCDFLTTAYERIMLISEAVLPMNTRRQNMVFGGHSNSVNNSYVGDDLMSSIDNHRNNMIDSSHNNVRWDGVHSILISAHEGAGKSYLLNKIEKSINELKYKEQLLRKTQVDNFEGDIRVLRLSGSDCDYRKGSVSGSPSSPSSSSSKTINRVSTGSSTSDKESLDVRYHLQWLIQVFAVDREANSKDMFDVHIDRGGIRIVLLIDNLDSILLSSMSDDDQGSDTNDKESVSATAGYHLRQLLYAIAVPSNNLIDRIMIIGTTRVSPSTLPRAHTGTTTTYHKNNFNFFFSLIYAIFTE
jgi:hypothetical protein